MPMLISRVLQKWHVEKLPLKWDASFNSMGRQFLYGHFQLVANK